MKRFYKLVTIAPVSGGYAVHLDGKPVKTPAKNALIAPDKDIADALMLEWAEQKEEIRPETMPLTQIISTCLDKVAYERPKMEEQIIKYFDTDLLCYRTEYPKAVGRAQLDVWNPVIKLFEDHFSVSIKTTTALQALTQPDQAKQALQAYIEGLSNERFTILQLVTPLCGSVMTGVLFTLQKISPDGAMKIARVEENFKDKIYDAEKYGPDPSLEKADKEMIRDLNAAAQFLELLPAK